MNSKANEIFNNLTSVETAYYLMNIIDEKCKDFLRNKPIDKKGDEYYIGYVECCRDFQKRTIVKKILIDITYGGNKFTFKDSDNEYYYQRFVVNPFELNLTEEFYFKTHTKEDLYIDDLNLRYLERYIKLLEYFEPIIKNDCNDEKLLNGYEIKEQINMYLLSKNNFINTFVHIPTLEEKEMINTVGSYYKDISTILAISYVISMNLREYSTQGYKLQTGFRSNNIIRNYGFAPFKYDYLKHFPHYITIEAKDVEKVIYGLELLTSTEEEIKRKIDFIYLSINEYLTADTYKNFYLNKFIAILTKYGFIKDNLDDEYIKFYNIIDNYSY